MFDVFCKRLLKFIRCCLSSSNALVSFILYRVMVLCMHSRMYSVLGCNIQLCSEKYKCRVRSLTNSFDTCISNIKPEMSDRSTVVWELLLMKDNLIFLFDVHFSDLDVSDLLQ